MTAQTLLDRFQRMSHKIAVEYGVDGTAEPDQFAAASHRGRAGQGSELRTRPVVVKEDAAVQIAYHHALGQFRHIDGWHRAFCLSVCAGRGSPDNPGLVLALDAGGACTGVAYRIAEGILRDELDLLWRREMVSGAYTPHWVDLVDPCAGGCFGRGIAFTIDPCAEQYAGGLAEDEVVRRLATASGALGSAADYLFRTCEGLRAHGIPDPELEHLASAVTGEIAYVDAGFNTIAMADFS